MLVVGNYETLMGLCDRDRSTFMVYNFSSLKEGVGLRLQLLPSTNLSVYDKEFDQFYMKFVYNQDVFFIELMNMVYSLYMGYNIYLMISDGDIYEAVAESLTKMIQCRYGYTAQFIHDSFDFDDTDDSNFSVAGIANFEQDRERYLALRQAYGLSIEGMI